MPSFCSSRLCALCGWLGLLASEVVADCAHDAFRSVLLPPPPFLPALLWLLLPVGRGWGLPCQPQQPGGAPVERGQPSLEQHRFGLIGAAPTLGGAPPARPQAGRGGHTGVPPPSALSPVRARAEKKLPLQKLASYSYLHCGCNRRLQMCSGSSPKVGTSRV